MKSKKLWILVIIIAILTAAVAVFAILNAGNIEDKQQSQNNATVTVIADEREETFNLEYLESFGKEEFSTTVDTSETDPQEQIFGGVPLATVLQELGFSLDNKEQVVFTAADGYTTVVTALEAADVQNVYLVYERDNKPLGTKQQGGTGPIEVVIAKDQYAQRWCKFLMEIEIQ